VCIPYVVMQNSTSWVLNNLASLYWRVKGRGDLAANCLLAAYHSAPSNAKVPQLICLY